MPSSGTKFSAKFVEVDLTPLLSAPFYNEPGFPNAAQAEVGRKVGEGFSSNGFLLASNFGPTDADLETVKEAGKEIWSMPTEKKMNDLKRFDFGNDGKIIGYRESGVESLNKIRHGDIKESYTVNRREMAEPENMKNVPESFKKATHDFLLKLEQGARTIGVAMALGLGIEPDFFVKNMQNLENNALRIMHYPPMDYIPQPTLQEKDAVRVSEHCDISMFTFVFTDTEGLQLRVEHEGEEGWVPIPLQTGSSCVVNTGHLTRRWTNDVYKITTHRCITETAEQASKDRYSALYFNFPDHSTILEPHASLVKDGKPNYPVIGTIEHLKVMRNKIIGKDAVVRDAS